MQGAITRMSFSISRYVPELPQANPEKKFTAREIARWIFETHRGECEEKRGRSVARSIPLDTDDALIQQIVAEIGAQRPSLQKRIPGIRTTEGRPRKYYFSTLGDADEAGPADVPDRGPGPPSRDRAVERDEAALYPALAEYLLRELNVFAKRIDERRASNQRGRGGNRWLFPDLVGMENSAQNGIAKSSIAQGNTQTRRRSSGRSRSSAPSTGRMSASATSKP